MLLDITYMSTDIFFNRKPPKKLSATPKEDSASNAISDKSAQLVFNFLRKGPRFKGFAKQLAENLGIQFIEAPITGTYQAANSSLQLRLQ